MKKNNLKKQWNKPYMERLTSEELKKVIFAGACTGYGGCVNRSVSPRD